MKAHQRFLLLLLLITCALLLLISRDNGGTIKSTRIWRHAVPSWLSKEELDRASEVVALQQDAASRETEIESMHIVPDDLSAFEAGPETTSASSFRAGQPKSPGSEYTKAVILGRLIGENTEWIDDEKLPPNITKYVYHPANHRSSTAQTLLTVPESKGHEAMVYLTYIIDHYDSLADVNIFMHAHQFAWHNNELLNHDAIEMINRLSAERVTRQGYMNLRCHWKPGCPEYIDPHTRQVDPEKQEEAAMASAWDSLFPGEQLPNVIAGPCCAQFAVSRERIQDIPLNRFVAFRKWLLKTELDDYISGRVFEYLWHKIFTAQATFCPDMRVCYCDGYGVCFKNDKEFDYWFELKYLRKEVEKKLTAWTQAVKRLQMERGQEWFEIKESYKLKGGDQSSEMSSIPALDGDVVLTQEMEGYRFLMEERRLTALKAGTDPRIRAKVAGREWKEGDGY